jgi:hypothetical protein
MGYIVGLYGIVWFMSRSHPTKILVMSVRVQLVWFVSNNLAAYEPGVVSSQIVAKFLATLERQNLAPKY